MATHKSSLEQVYLSQSQQKSALRRFSVFPSRGLIVNKLLYQIYLACLQLSADIIFAIQMCCFVDKVNHIIIYRNAGDYSY